MFRRTFLTGAMALGLALPAMASAETIDYTPGVIQSALKEGKTVFIDYATDWCSTCQRQERVISAIRDSNPAYDEAMVFVRVDWDEYGTHQVSTALKIPRRSTLVVLKGNKELGRIVAGTSVEDIKALMDTGLAAASS